MPGELIWPVLTLVGLVALCAVVVALGTRSTARYEFERNQAQERRRQAAAAVPAPAPDAVPVPGAAGHGSRRAASGSAAPAASGKQRAEAASVQVAAHTPGMRGRATVPAWWLVDLAAGGPDEEVVAGPFGDRVDAEWVALSRDLADSVRADHGVLREDGGLDRRSLPGERTWTHELGSHLVRLGPEWDDVVTDDDALGTLVVDVAAALVEAGLPLHDCAGDGPGGGVCLTPDHGSGGVLVSWHRHDRMSVDQVRGAALDAAVQRTMNAALAELLTSMGCVVRQAGEAGCSVVTAVRG